MLAYSKKKEDKAMAITMDAYDLDLVLTMIRLLLDRIQVIYSLAFF
jgi:hypothetical protein